MKSMSKLCDAADWFDPEIDQIIRIELREPARLHRKQWEFAAIFLVLRRLAMVRSDRIGLSLGGGTERLLYALATHIKHMTVTDLYDPHTSWDCARTDNPDEFVRSQKPFEVDDAKYNALRMDMRSLEFPDRSFDFCYSSCAIEHIGDDADFIRHFNEVARVLRDDGVYIFTTETSYLSHTIKDPNNYVFAPDYLADLIGASNLEPVFDCEAMITHNRANLPMPWEILQTVADNGDDITRRLIESIPHITLLRGRYPFGSGLFVLKKCKSLSARKRLRFVGLDDLESFMEAGVRDYLNMVGSSLENFVSPSAERKAQLCDTILTAFRGVTEMQRLARLNSDAPDSAARAGQRLVTGTGKEGRR